MSFEIKPSKNNNYVKVTKFSNELSNTTYCAPYTLPLVHPIVARERQAWEQIGSPLPSPPAYSPHSPLQTSWRFRVCLLFTLCRETSKRGNKLVLPPLPRQPTRLSPRFRHHGACVFVYYLQWGNDLTPVPVICVYVLLCACRLFIFDQCRSVAGPVLRFLFPLLLS